MLIVPISSIVGTICHYSRLSYGKYFLIILVLIIVVPLQKRYLSNKSISKKNYKVFEDKWREEDRKQRKMRSWYIVLLLINNLLVFPFIVIKLSHYFF